MCCLLTTGQALLQTFRTSCAKNWTSTWSVTPQTHSLTWQLFLPVVVGWAYATLLTTIRPHFWHRGSRFLKLTRLPLQKTCAIVTACNDRLATCGQRTVQRQLTFSGCPKEPPMTTHLRITSRLTCANKSGGPRILWSLAAIILTTQHPNDWLCYDAVMQARLLIPSGFSDVLICNDTSRRRLGRNTCAIALERR